MPAITISVSPYKSAAELRATCALVLQGRWRAGHHGPIRRERQVRMTHAEAARRLGVSAPNVTKALNESDGGTRYHALRVRILREIGGFAVREEPRWHVGRREEQ